MESDLKLVIACGFCSCVQFVLVLMLALILRIYERLITSISFLFSYIFHQFHNEMKPHKLQYGSHTLHPSLHLFDQSEPFCVAILSTQRLDCVLFFIIYADS